MKKESKIAIGVVVMGIIIVGALIMGAQAAEKPYELSGHAQEALDNKDYDTSGEPVLLRYNYQAGAENQRIYRFDFSGKVPNLGPVSGKMKMKATERVVSVQNGISTREMRFSDIQFEIPGEEIPDDARAEIEKTMRQIRVTAKFDGRGNVTDVQTSGLPAGVQAMATEFFKELMSEGEYTPEFPENALAAGETWTDTETYDEDGVQGSFTQTLTYHGVVNTHWGRMRALTTELESKATSIEQDMFSRVESTIKMKGKVKSLRNIKTMGEELERGDISVDVHMKDLNSNLSEQVKIKVNYTAEPVSDNS